jgi:hypothetical protein
MLEKVDNELKLLFRLTSNIRCTYYYPTVLRLQVECSVWSSLECLARNYKLDFWLLFK